MKTILVAMFVVGLLLVGGAFLFGTGNSAVYSYTGKEVFQTTQEYTTFKEVVGTPEVSLKDMVILSSDPPIVAQFILEAPRSLDFLYGDRSSLPVGCPFNPMFGGGLGLVVVVLFVRGLERLIK